MTIFIDYVDHVYVHLNKTHENLMGMLFIFLNFYFKLKLFYLFSSEIWIY